MSHVFGNLAICYDNMEHTSGFFWASSGDVSGFIYWLMNAHRESKRFTDVFTPIYGICTEGDYSSEDIKWFTDKPIYHI